MLIAVAKWGIIINTLFYVYLSPRFPRRNCHVPSTSKWLQVLIIIKRNFDYRIKNDWISDINQVVKLTLSKNNARKMPKSWQNYIIIRGQNSHSNYWVRGLSFNYNFPKSFGIWRRATRKICQTRLIPLPLKRAVNGSCYDYEARVVIAFKGTFGAYGPNFSSATKKLSFFPRSFTVHREGRVARKERLQ